MGCRMVGWSNFLAQRGDVEEHWMYAYARSEKGSRCVALLGRLSCEVGVEVLYAVVSAYAANRATRSRHIAESHRLERLMYTKQTVYDTLQMLYRSRFIRSRCH